MNHDLSVRRLMTATPHALSASVLFAVALGGALGASARWSIGAIAPETPAGAVASWPWATLIANLLGCLAIGVAASRCDRSSLGWSFVGTGLLGGFTTMSAFAVETNELFEHGRPVAGAMYLGLTLAAGVLAVAVGQRAPRTGGTVSRHDAAPDQT